MLCRCVRWMSYTRLSIPWLLLKRAQQFSWCFAGVPEIAAKAYKGWKKKYVNEIIIIKGNSLRCFWAHVEGSFNTFWCSRSKNIDCHCHTQLRIQPLTEWPVFLWNLQYRCLLGCYNRSFLLACSKHVAGIKPRISDTSFVFVPFSVHTGYVRTI